MRVREINFRAKEAEWLLKMAADDQRAFRSIYDTYNTNIYKYALHLLKSEELAHENVQETFLKFWNMRKEAVGVLNLESYLVTISRNAALDVLRKSRLTLRSETTIRENWVEGHNETDEKITLEDTRRILQEGIDQLPPQQKLVYELCHRQGLKYNEAAAQLNISPNTVKLYMKLSLRFLRGYLARHTDLAAIFIIFKLF
ncbi:RNA polymerase sigma-70 factor (family 1) [Pedobacter africanus]